MSTKRQKGKHHKRGKGWHKRPSEAFRTLAALKALEKAVQNTEPEEPVETIQELENETNE